MSTSKIPVVIGAKFPGPKKIKFLDSLLPQRARKGNLERKLIRLEKKAIQEVLRTGDMRHLHAINRIASVRLQLLTNKFGQMPDFYSHPDTTQQLSPRAILERFLSPLRPEYTNQISQLAEQMGPMRRECTISLCIPVAAHEEGGYIRRALESFLKQTLTPEKFEIVLLANHPTSDQYNGILKPDQTLQELERFQTRFSEFPLRWAYAIFPPRLARIGYIRHVLNDVVIRRHLDRGVEFEDHLLGRLDADTAGVHPLFLAYYLKLFEQHPLTDSFHGPLRGAPEELAQNPIIFACDVLQEVIYRYVHIKEKGPLANIGGANFVCRASAYAAVGGYPPQSNLGEDIELGNLLRKARSESGLKSHSAVSLARTPASLAVSTRRAETAFRAGYAPIEQWSHEESAFGIENLEIRKQDFRSHHCAEEVERMLLQTEDLKHDLSRFLSRVIDFYHRNLGRYVTSDASPVSRALIFVNGLDFQILTETKILVTDLGRFPERFRYFRDHADQTWAHREKGTRYFD